MTSAYVYKWTHIPTLKWYIGSRTARGCYPDDGYLCSSKTVKLMIIENDKDWIREIIATGSQTEMYELETNILQLFDAKNDTRSFNKHNGDGLFNSDGHLKGTKMVHKGDKCKRVKPDVLEKLLAEGWILGTPKSTKEKISSSTKGTIKKGHANGGPKKGSIPWNKGKKETRASVLKKMSLSHKGKTYNKETKIKGEIQ